MIEGYFETTIDLGDGCAVRLYGARGWSSNLSIDVLTRNMADLWSDGTRLAICAATSAEQAIELGEKLVQAGKRLQLAEAKGE